MNLCAEDLNPFRSIVASSLFFYCKLEMIQFDKAGLHIHHVRFTCYRFFMCVFLQVHRRENTFEILRVHTDDIDITHLNCVSLSFGLLWKLKPYKNLQNLRTKCQNVSQIRRGKSYSKHQHRFACYYIYIFFFGGVQAVFFGGRQRVLLGKPRFNKRGCFPSILSCRYTFPGPGDSALPFGTGENPLWFGIQSHLLCGFSPTIFAGTRYSAKSKKKMETVDELDPRILNHLEMYQTPQNHSDITSNSPRKMKQRSWRELKCCEISGYLDAQWSKSWLGGKRSSKWKKPCWRSIWVICRV